MSKIKKNLFVAILLVFLVTVFSTLILIKARDNINPDLLYLLVYINNDLFYITLGISLVTVLLSSLIFHLVKKAHFIIFIILLVLQTFLLVYLIYLGLIYTYDLEYNILQIITGIMLSLLIAAYLSSHPIINKSPSFIFGIKTNYTLSNKKAWLKVNRFNSISGILMCIVGYVITLLTLAKWNVLFLLIGFLAVIPTIIYHQHLIKNDDDLIDKEVVN